MTRQVLLTPTWLGRTVVALLAIGACVVASVWQYQRTQDQLTVARAALSATLPYAEVVPDGMTDLGFEQLGHNTSVTGEVVPGARTLIRDRLSPRDERGFLVVDGVRLDDDRVVAVLQGWVRAPAEAPDLAGSRIEVTGRVQPDENFYPDAPIAASGPLVTITAAGLEQQWSDTPTPGYVTVTRSRAAAEFEPVTPLIGTDPDVPFPLQNAFYSLQWLIFAGLIGFMWARFLREDIREAQASRS